MIIDSHTHAGVRCEADWDFESLAEHRRHDQRLLVASRCQVRKLKDDSVVEEGWKTLWDEGLLNSWEGIYDVNLRIEWEKERESKIKFHPPIFVWEKDGEKYYAPESHVLTTCIKAPPPELLLSLMDKVGVDKAVLNISLPIPNLNKFYSRVVHEYPKRIIGLCHIDEATAYSKENIEKLHICVEELGLKGIYHAPLADWGGYDNFHTEKYDPFWREVESLGIPVYMCGGHFDVFDEVVPKLAKLLKKFPTLTLVITHGIPPGYMAEGIPEILADIIKNYDVQMEILPNIFDYGPNDEIIRLLYDAFGPSKIIWGSEFAAYETVGPPFTAERYAECLNYLEKRCEYMSKDDLSLILGGNLQRVFGI